MSKRLRSLHYQREIFGPWELPHVRSRRIIRHSRYKILTTNTEKSTPSFRSHGRFPECPFSHPRRLYRRVFTVACQPRSKKQHPPRPTSQCPSASAWCSDQPLTRGPAPSAALAHTGFGQRRAPRRPSRSRVRARHLERACAGPIPRLFPTALRRAPSASST